MTGCRSVPFVRAENAGRSQMAEASFRKYAPTESGAASAGTAPPSGSNPPVARTMGEIGIGLGGQRPKTLSDGMVADSLVTVSTGCTGVESCPPPPPGKTVDWNIPDPGGRSIGEVREIRDQIRAKVLELAATLEENNGIL